MYDDDVFGGVLDLEQLADDNDDKSKPIQEVIAEKNNGGVDRSVECTGNVDAKILAFECVHDSWGVTELKVGIPNKDAKFMTKPIFERTLNETQMAPDAFTITSIPSAYATLKKLKIGRQFDTGWQLTFGMFNLIMQILILTKPDEGFFFFCSRTFLSIMGGVVAGIWGFTGLMGFVFYLLIMAIASLGLLAKAKFSVGSYFDSWNRIILDGFFGGLMSFVLFWTYPFNVSLPSLH
ncbi:hypothetical protein IEQ34_009437 [Dendrobium chrysotoxum]|uniref:ER membrane protein complex subunit 6 n=1 Tax=Dendrobium chrysotoxum TaxID=161865 RepID=A0AAV7GZ64_DENCH|nr:hypothetical protein IEQ34_009437 [Dendrobium chrysotoxum]